MRFQRIDEISEKAALRCSKYFMGEKPLSLRSNASKVTLSGFAGGEYLPLPASKGPAFPFPSAALRTSSAHPRWYPTSPTTYAQGQRFSPNIHEIPEIQTLNLRPFCFAKNCYQKNFNPVVAKMLTSAIGKLSEIWKGLREINPHFNSTTG